MNKENTPPKVSTSGQVALPFNEDQFKDFIVSLLGKPQTITKYLRGSYEINKDNLVSLFEIVNQRIYQQNDSKLIQFRATIYYNDNTTVTLNGLDHLVYFNDKLPLVSTAVHLTWQYLVKFRDKETFEKQEISVSFITETDGRVPIFDEDTYHRFHDDGISFRISHTARTWGADIEAILTKHLKTIVKKESKILSFFRYNSENVQHAVSAILIAITLVISLYQTLSLRSENAHSKDSIFWIHHYGSYIFLVLGIRILLKVTLVILEEFEFYSSPSFILLTPESEKNKIKKLSNYKKKWSRYLGTIILSILLGIIANYVYHYLSGN